jgi:Peptidase family S41
VLSKVTNKSIEQLDDLIDEIEAAPLVLDSDAPVGADILVWRMPGFRSPDAVQRAIRKARGYKTLILDLRGNGGGALTALSALVSTTFDHEVLVAVDRPRGKERPEVAKPAKNAFLGKLFVLVDSRSASASEMFARILQLEKRGRRRRPHDWGGDGGAVLPAHRRPRRRRVLRDGGDRRGRADVGWRRSGADRRGAGRPRAAVPRGPGGEARPGSRPCRRARRRIDDAGTGRPTVRRALRRGRTTYGGW